MPRFEPHYVTAQFGAVDPRYVTALGASTSAPPPSTPAEKKQFLKQNRSKVQEEINKKLPNTVTVNTDGSLHLINPLTPMNQQMALLLRGAHGAIDASPLSATLKNKLKTQPVTFFVDLFDPVLDLIRDALIEVMERGINRSSTEFKNRTTKDTGALGVGGFVYDLSTPPFIFTLGNPEFRNVNIWLYPPDDEMFDEESRGILLRMRMLLAYFVLFFRKPVELQTTLLSKGLDALFGEKVTLVSTTGEETNSPSSPKIVDAIPDVSASLLPVREGNNVYRVTVPAARGYGTTTYYALSAVGRYRRAVDLRDEWDRKYQDYKNDKITNPAGVVLYGARMTYLRMRRGKTEAQARNIIAQEDNFPRQFAETRNLPSPRFRVFGKPKYGGGIAAVTNGPRPTIPAKPAGIAGLGTYVWLGGRGLSGLGALGAEPATTTVAAKGTADVGTAAGGGEAGAATITAWLGGIAGILTAVGGAIAAIVTAVNQPAVEEQRARRAEADAEGAKARAESEGSSGTSPMLILGVGAAVALLFLMSRRPQRAE